MNRFYCLSSAVVGAALSLGHASAASLVFNLVSSSDTTFAPSSITVSDVGGSPTESSPYLSVSGSLDASGSLSFFADAAGDDENYAPNWSLSGNNLSIITSANVSATTTGWGAVGGGIRTEGKGQLLALTFDLTSLSLGAGETLVLQSFTTDLSQTGVIDYIVDGVSVSDAISPDSAGGTTYTVNTTVTDGLRLAWTGQDATTPENSGAFKVTSLTFTVVPEPSVAGLIGLGLGVACLTRRRWS